MRLKLIKTKLRGRIQRKKRIRAKISGISSKPRVTLFRSNRYLSVQAIDDTTETTLVASNSKLLGEGANIAGAVALAKDMAQKLKSANISEITFDRNGYIYHGVVKAFAEELRANEIKF